ncbi:MAG: hypothetical protein CBE26_04750 [Kiritimatiellaceae bacterium TMED266]|nr:MAG: hypothetical protein CBE26_04750 [Kiritimatiellaceae bacterium TMED266]
MHFRKNLTYNVKAVIDIGSTSIRMVMAEVHPDKDVKVLESLTQSVSLGRDTFTKGRISSATTLLCIEALRDFLAVANTYQLNIEKDIRAVATSAVREASNHLEFMDRIFTATGIEIALISGAEVNRLTFFAIQPYLAKHEELRKQHALFIEMGGGSTELIGLKKGRISFSHTHRIGFYRLSESADKANTELRPSQKMLHMELRTLFRNFQEQSTTTVQRPVLVFMGSEARLAAQLLDDAWEVDTISSFRCSEVDKLIQRIRKLRPEQIATRYQIPYDDAQTVEAAWSSYLQIAQEFGVKRIYTCNATMRDGLLSELRASSTWQPDFIAHVLHSAKNIARRYQVDMKHAGHVCEHALQLFEALKNEHQLGVREQVFLQVSAWLHDVGHFVDATAHHKHSRYLIENSQIFGLTPQEIKLCAMIARYHRGATPKNSHADYQNLSRHHRRVVNNLASILRIAEALDASHSQRLHIEDVEFKEDRLELLHTCEKSISVEEMVLDRLAKMVRQVYGRSVVLKKRKSRKSVQ